VDLPHLIALDLDGTLLPESKQLTDFSRRTLGSIESLGVCVALATGKFLHLAQVTATELGGAHPVVALDGARTSNDGARLERCIDRDTLLTVLDAHAESCWHAFCDSGDDEMLLASSSIDDFAFMTRYWAEAARPVADLRAHLVGDPGIACFYGPPDEMEELADEVAGAHPELAVSVFESPMTGGRRVTLQSRGVSKGSGVELLASELGLEIADCLVFGDWLNDLSMFATGARAVAMANAVPEVKEAADEVTEYDCESDGVARFLAERFL
jgi:Cof subfamily protein (haloacid dehalogenase superfamily)